jgi:LysR family glycine cleavage system transcriptional activator
VGRNMAVGRDGDKRLDLAQRERESFPIVRAPNHLNALRALEAAARHLSFVAAAEELNVTPAAISQLVRGLEETLGVELFRRSQAGPGRLVLTEAAQLALPDLQSGFDHLSAAMNRLKSARARRTLTVTVPPAFADTWLLARVERFGACHPEYELRIDTSGRLVDFAAEGIDVGIRYGAGQWPGLTATFLARDEFFPVCSPDLLSGAHPLRTAADLKHHPLIHDKSMASEPLFPTWPTWLSHFGQSVADSDRGLQINDSAAVFQTAMAGNGVALGRTTLVARDLAEGRLVRPFGEALKCALAYYVVYRPQDGADPAIQAFRDWLLEEAASN